MVNDSAVATLAHQFDYPYLFDPVGAGWVPPQDVLDAPDRVAMETGLRLGTPSPNPARQTVSFQLQLARPAPTRIDVLDLGGRRWWSLSLPNLGAGASRFQWALHGEDGRRAPAGRYIVRVTSGADVRTAGFLIVR